MKSIYVVLWTWQGRGRRGKFRAHAARRLLGRQGYTHTACGRDLSDFASVDVYHVHAWYLQPGNPLSWCERCRSELIARLDAGEIAGLAPFSNTGFNSSSAPAERGG